MDEYLAVIRIFAGNFAPRGWAFCDGRLLPISNNEALYSLLGTSYGGDGQTNFALPDMRVIDSTNTATGAHANYVGFEGLPQMRYIICLEGVYPSRT